MTTPKLHQMQEVHQTTILEENETMRGSMEYKYPGTRLGLHGQGGNILGSNQKKYKNIQMENKKSNAQQQPQVRRGHANKQLRTKSSVSGANMHNPDGVAQTSNTASSSTHPMQKSKIQNPKQHYSSSNLDDSIGGIVGNGINQNQTGRQHNSNANSRTHQKVTSPNVR